MSAPISPPSEAAYDSLSASMRAIATAIRDRAPQASVVFVPYVRLVTQAACDENTLSVQEAAIIGEMADRLAQITARTAREAGALYLPVDAESEMHLPCSAEPWGRGLAAGYDGSEGAPWHPTAECHAAIADRLAELLAG